MRVRAAWILPCLVVVPACVEMPLFYCTSHSECVTEEVQGRCELSSYCSFPDGRCDSGWRYGTNAGEMYRGVCVEDRTIADTGDVEAGEGPSGGSSGEAGGDTGAMGTSSGGMDVGSDESTTDEPTELVVPTHFGCIEPAVMFDEFDGSKLNPQWAQYRDTSQCAQCSIDQVDGHLVLSAGPQRFNGVVLNERRGFAGLTVFGTFAPVDDLIDANFVFDVDGPCEAAIMLNRDEVVAGANYQEVGSHLIDPYSPTAVRMHIELDQITYDVFEDDAWVTFHTESLSNEGVCTFQFSELYIDVYGGMVLPVTRRLENIGLCQTQ